MADPLSVVASIVGIAAAGVKVSISLFALAETVKTAGKRIESIANDISSTCGILNQIRELIDPKPLPDGTYTSFFTRDALRDISTALSHCNAIFTEINTYLERASRQIKGVKKTSSTRRAGPPPLRASAASVRRRDSGLKPAPAAPDSKIELSHGERAKWPFLQPQFNDLRADLRDAKSNLLLMVAVSHLALANRGTMGVEVGRVVDEKEKLELKATIVRLKRGRTMDLGDRGGGVGAGEKEKEKGFRHFVISFKKFFGSKEGKDESSRRDGARGLGGLVVVDEQGRLVDGENGRPRAHVPPVQSQKRDSLEQGAPGPSSPNKPTDTPHPGDAISEHAGISEKDDEMGQNLARVDAVSQKGSIHNVDSEPDDEGADSPVNDPHDYIPITLDAEAQKDEPLEDPASPANPSSPIPAHESVLEAEPDHRLERDQWREKEARLLDNTVSSIHVWIEEEPLDHHEASIRIASPAPSTHIPQSKFHAWTTGVLAGLHSGLGRSVTIHEIVLSEEELAKIVNVEGPENLLTSLNKLNVYQRRLVLAHASNIDSVLVHVEICGQDKVPTVFGEQDVESLLWITTREDGGVVVFDREDFFGTKDDIERLTQRQRTEKSKAHEADAAELRRREELERRKLEERRELERRKFEERRAFEMRTREAAEEKNLLRIRKTMEEKLIKAKEEEEASLKTKEPIKFYSVRGKTYSFPFYLAHTWEGMHNLIKDASANDYFVFNRISQGQFDVVGPDGEIIMPALWESLVRPGWEVSLRMHPHFPPRPPPTRPRTDIAGESYPVVYRRGNRRRRSPSSSTPDSGSEGDMYTDSNSSTSSSVDVKRAPGRFARLKRLIPPITTVRMRKESDDFAVRVSSRKTPVLRPARRVERVRRVSEMDSGALHHGGRVGGGDDVVVVEEVDSVEDEDEGDGGVSLTDEQVVDGLMNKWIQSADTKDADTKGKGKNLEENVIS